MLLARYSPKQRVKQLTSWALHRRPPEQQVVKQLTGRTLLEPPQLPFEPPVGRPLLDFTSQEPIPQ